MVGPEGWQAWLQRYRPAFWCRKAGIPVRFCASLEGHRLKSGGIVSRNAEAAAAGFR
jgi:hypothetical protein